MKHESKQLKIERATIADDEQQDNNITTTILCQTQILNQDGVKEKAETPTEDPKGVKTEVQ